MPSYASVLSSPFDPKKTTPPRSTTAAPSNIPARSGTRTFKPMWKPRKNQPAPAPVEVIITEDDPKKPVTKEKPPPPTLNSKKYANKPTNVNDEPLYSNPSFQFTLEMLAANSTVKSTNDQEKPEHQQIVDITEGLATEKLSCETPIMENLCVTEVTKNTSKQQSPGEETSMGSEADIETKSELEEEDEWEERDGGWEGEDDAVDYALSASETTSSQRKIITPKAIPTPKAPKPKEISSPPRCIGAQRTLRSAIKKAIQAISDREGMSITEPAVIEFLGGGTIGPAFLAGMSYSQIREAAKSEIRAFEENLSFTAGQETEGGMDKMDDENDTDMEDVPEGLPVTNQISNFFSPNEESVASQNVVEDMEVDQLDTEMNEAENISISDPKYQCKEPSIIYAPEPATTQEFPADTSHFPRSTPNANGGPPEQTYTEPTRNPDIVQTSMNLSDRVDLADVSDAMDYEESEPIMGSPLTQTETIALVPTAEPVQDTEYKVPGDDLVQVCKDISFIEEVEVDGGHITGDRGVGGIINTPIVVDDTEGKGVLGALVVMEVGAEPSGSINGLTIDGGSESTGLDDTKLEVVDTVCESPGEEDAEAFQPIYMEKSITIHPTTESTENTTLGAETDTISQKSEVEKEQDTNNSLSLTTQESTLHQTEKVQELEGFTTSGAVADDQECLAEALPSPEKGLQTMLGDGLEVGNEEDVEIEVGGEYNFVGEEMMEDKDIHTWIAGVPEFSAAKEMPTGGRMGKDEEDRRMMAEILEGIEGVSKRFGNWPKTSRSESEHRVKEGGVEGPSKGGSITNEGASPDSGDKEEFSTTPVENPREPIRATPILAVLGGVYLPLLIIPFLSFLFLALSSAKLPTQVYEAGSMLVAAIPNADIFNIDWVGATSVVVELVAMGIAGSKWLRINAIDMAKTMGQPKEEESREVARQMFAEVEGVRVGEVEVDWLNNTAGMGVMVRGESHGVLRQGRKFLEGVVTWGDSHPVESNPVIGPVVGGYCSRYELGIGAGPLGVEAGAGERGGRFGASALGFVFLSLFVWGRGNRGQLRRGVGL